MNDQTLKFIEQLAQKLGTTAEYLWAVLVEQAIISATIDVGYFILMLIFGGILLKFHLYFSKCKYDEHGQIIEHSIYYEKDEIVAIPMLLLSILWGIFALVCLFSIDNIITGFVNPEYWALNEILKLK